MNICPLVITQVLRYVYEINRGSDKTSPFLLYDPLLYLIPYKGILGKKFLSHKGVITMILFLKLFTLTYPLFVLMDILWLGFIMGNTYKEQLHQFLLIENGSMQIQWPIACAVWSLIVIGSLYFALPLVKENSLISAFGHGALYGFILYGVYDLTNYAMINKWPLSITLLDIGWGTFANGIFLTLAVLIKRRFL
jgi:uncharacterized membrane protein